MTDLNEIATVSGKGGLYKVLKPGRSGLVLESLDEKKVKFVTTPNHKVSVLKEISIFTTGKEGSLGLDDVLRKINKEFRNDPGVDNKSSNDELMSFLGYLVPDYDKERVYPSDVKKLINWYQIILKEFPEYFKEPAVKEKKSASTAETHLVPEKKTVKPKPSQIERSHTNKTNTKGAMKKTVATPVKAGKKSP
jgi:hypothetical protein